MVEQKPAATPDVGLSALAVNWEQLIDTLEDKLFVIDVEYHIKFANLAARQTLTKDESIDDKHCYEVFQGRNSPCSSPLWKCPLSRVLQSGEGVTIIASEHALNAETETKCFKLVLYPVKDGRGNIVALVESRRDVTAEKELENQILRRHHHLHALNRISNAISGLWNLDAILNIALDTVLEIINTTTGGILLLDEQSQKLRYRVYRGLSPSYVEQMEMGLGEGIAGKVAQTGEPMILKDISQQEGVVRPDLVSTQGLRGFISVPIKAKDRVLGVMNVASHTPGRFSPEDVYILNSVGCQLGTAIEQAKLYQRLEQGKERYQALLQHALKAQEEERKRIARELHDETSQALTSLTLNLQAVITKAETDRVVDDDLISRLRKIQSLAVHTQSEISKLMKELRPTLLDELGLPAAISRYAKDSLEPLGTKIFTEFHGLEGRLPPEVEVTLFRIAQGTIGNIMEHAEAKNVFIRLTCNDNECILNVEDDGKGFDVSKLTRVDKSGRGAGLFTMKERARLVGGECSIKSQPGKGTRVTVRVPLRGFGEDVKNKGADR